jgi:hypothetical protein
MARCEPDSPIHGCGYDTVDGVDRQVRLKIPVSFAKLGRDGKIWGLNWGMWSSKGPGCISSRSRESEEQTNKKAPAVAKHARIRDLKEQ